MPKQIHIEKVSDFEYNGIALDERVRILDRHWLLPEFGYVRKIHNGQYKFSVQPEGMNSHFMFFENEIEKIKGM